MGKGSDLFNGGAAAGRAPQAGGRGAALFQSGAPVGATEVEADPGDYIQNADGSRSAPPVGSFMGSEWLGQKLYELRDAGPVNFAERIGRDTVRAMDEYGARIDERRAAGRQAGLGDVAQSLGHHGPFSGDFWDTAGDAINSGLSEVTNFFDGSMTGAATPFISAGSQAAEAIDAAVPVEADDGALTAYAKRLLNVPRNLGAVLSGAMQPLSEVPQRTSNTLQGFGVDKRTADNLGEFALDVLPLVPPAAGKLGRGLAHLPTPRLPKPRLPTAANRAASVPLRSLDPVVPHFEDFKRVPGPAPIESPPMPLDELRRRAKVGAPAELAEARPLTVPGRALRDIERAGFSSVDEARRALESGDQGVQMLAPETVAALRPRSPSGSPNTALLADDLAASSGFDTPLADGAFPRTEKQLARMRRAGFETRSDMLAADPDDARFGRMYDKDREQALAANREARSGTETVGPVTAPEKYVQVSVSSSPEPVFIRTDEVAQSGLVPQVAPRRPPTGGRTGPLRGGRGRQGGFALLPPKATRAQKAREFRRGNMPADTEVANRLVENLWRKPRESAVIKVNDVLEAAFPEKWGWLKEQSANWLMKREGRTGSRQFGTRFRAWRSQRDVARDSAAGMARRAEREFKQLGAEDARKLQEAMDARNRDGFTLDDPDLEAMLQDGPVADVVGRVSENQAKLVDGGMLSPDTAQHNRNGYLTRVTTEKGSFLRRFFGPKIKKKRYAKDTHGVALDRVQVEKLGLDHDALKQIATSLDEAATVTPDGLVKFSFTDEGMAAREQFAAAIRGRAKERAVEQMRKRAPDASEYRPKKGVDYRDPVTETFDGLSLDERIAAGETMDIGKRVFATIYRQESDLAAMDFFQYVRRGESGGVPFVSKAHPNSIQWDTSPAPPGLGSRFKVVKDRPLFVDEDGVRWRQMPDDGFGPLNGQAVREDIAAEIMDSMSPAARAGAVDFLIGVTNSWKMVHTILSPATAVRQYVSLPQFSILAGVSVFNPANLTHWKSGLQRMSRNHPQHAELKQWGIIRGGSYTEAELGDLLRATNDVEWNARTIGELISAPYMFSKHVRQGVGKLGQAYNFADEWLRATAYSKARAVGMSPEEAATYVNKWTPTLDDAGKLTRGVSKIGAPFFRFQMESYRIGGHAMLEHPVRFAMAAAMRWETQTVLGLLGISAELSDDEQEMLENELHGQFLVGPRDDEGRPMLLDATWGLLGGAEASGPDHTLLNESDLARWGLGLVGVEAQPFVKEGMETIQGRDEYGRPIGTPSERETLMGSAWAGVKHIGAGFVPFSRETRRITKALDGERYSSRRPAQTLGEAALHSFLGWNQFPLDPDIFGERVRKQRHWREQETKRLTLDMSKEEREPEIESMERAFGEASERLEVIKRAKKDQRRAKRQKRRPR